MSKDLLKDLEYAKNFVHTGRLESYHNLRLKYMPKRIHLKYKGMHMRCMIAIIDHNHNINKKELGDKMVYSNPAGRYILKTKYEHSNDEWHHILMSEIKKKMKEITLTITEFEIVAIPQTIAPQPKPNYEDLMKTKYSRFSRK